MNIYTHLSDGFINMSRTWGIAKYGFRSLFRSHSIWWFFRTSANEIKSLQHKQNVGGAPEQKKYQSLPTASNKWGLISGLFILVCSGPCAIVLIWNINAFTMVVYLNYVCLRNYLLENIFCTVRRRTQPDVSIIIILTKNRILRKTA